MNQQPTAILLKFTDFLDNRDSLAFLRLCRCFWSSHQTPAGRYRLKPKVKSFDNQNGHSYLSGPTPSSLPPSFFAGDLNRFEEFSSRGNIFVDFLTLAEPEDFRIFNEKRSKLQFSAGIEGDTKRQKLVSTRRPFDSVKNIVCWCEELAALHEDQIHNKPETIESLTLMSYLSRRKLFSWLETGPVVFPNLKILDFSDLTIKKKDSKKFLDLPIIKQQRKLQILRLPQHFNCILEPDSLPPTLTELTLGDNFSSQILPFALPESLESLRFDDENDSDFNHPLPFPLPSGLKQLYLGHSYNAPILPGQLPAGLKILKLGFLFNQNIARGVFPEGMEEIFFDYNFAQPLPVLPSSLKRLTLYISETPEPSFFPPSLDFLMIGRNCWKWPPPKWPKLPKSLKSLELDDEYEIPIDSIDFFPPQLRVIDFGFSFFSPLKPGIFPSSVEEIILPRFNLPLEASIFPSGLKKISFGAYNQPLPVGIFPDGIRSIDLGYSYTASLPVGLFPSSVRELKISTKSPILPGVFPEGVESITFSCFNERLVPGIFPSSLRCLRFSGHLFQEEILPGVLPADLCELDLDWRYHGHFLFSSLPPNFRPDVLNSDKFISLARDSPLPEAKVLLARYGEGKFLANSLRISTGSDFVILSPVSGNSPAPFIVSRLFVNWYGVPF